MTELARLAAASEGSAPEFFHYRDAKQREVDLVMEWTDGYIVAVEVTSSRSVSSEHRRSLTYLRDKVGPAFKAGLILHPGEATLPFGDRIWSVPIAGLWTS